jgi:PadR family transcriptional regulator PadR
MVGEALKGHLDLLLLSVLAEESAHGYAVIETLRRRSGGTFDLPEGTIYPALHRLEDQGFLTSTWEEQGGRRKRRYRITPKGTLALKKHREDWQRFSQAVNSTVWS